MMGGASSRGLAASAVERLGDPERWRCSSARSRTRCPATAWTSSSVCLCCRASHPAPYQALCRSSGRRSSRVAGFCAYSRRLEAQLRFEEGQKVGDHRYVKADGTSCFYFDLDDQLV